MDKYLIWLVGTILIASLSSENYACKSNSINTSVVRYYAFNTIADRLSDDTIEPEDTYSVQEYREYRESRKRMIEWRERIGRSRFDRLRRSRNQILKPE